MASCMVAPGRYLKQFGLIIKLINKVLWHSSQWIIIKDLKISISKMRLKLVWDNFNPSPEIIHLFSSDNSFVCHGGKLIFIITSVGEKRRTRQTFPMARPKCLMGNFTNLYRIYKAHQTNV